MYYFLMLKAVHFNIPYSLNVSTNCMYRLQQISRTEFSTTYRLGSISSSLNARIFRTKIRFGSFFNVHVSRKSCQNVSSAHEKNVDEIDGLRKFLDTFFEPQEEDEVCPEAKLQATINIISPPIPPPPATQAIL
jgi:hypothetical protein